MTRNNHPQRQHHDDAGCDMSAMNAVEIGPHRGVAVHTGYRPLPDDIPEGSVGLVFARSSLHRRGLLLANGVGVIDAGYRGEVMLPLANTTQQPVVIKEGERLAQIVVVPLDLSSALYAQDSNTTQDNDNSNNNEPRGTGGFGSTGRN